MAKLYWRVTVNGKRTWRSAKVRYEYLEVPGLPGMTTRTIVVEDYEETKSES